MFDFTDKPYQLFHGDSAHVLAAFPDECIDLTVTSPPYDNLREYKGFTFDFESIAKELFRVTKKGGVVVWVVGDATINGSETGTSFRQALYFKEIGFWLYDTMIWSKPCITTPTESRYYNTFEYMFVFSKDKPKSLNLLSDRLNITSGSIRVKHSNIRKEKRGLTGESFVLPQFGRRFNVWEINPYSAPIDHPAIFPGQLANDHIISWSNPGDVVLDCFLGSGTTGKMAIINKRKFVGIEISEEYLEIAKARIGRANLEPIEPPKRIIEKEMPLFDI